jgi:hypothetical protein
MASLYAAEVQRPCLQAERPHRVDAGGQDGEQIGGQRFGELPAHHGISSW